MKLFKLTKFFSIILLCSLFMGCATWRDNIALRAGYTSLNKANAELKVKQDALDQAKINGDKAIGVAKDEVTVQKNTQYNQLFTNFSSTSDWTYGTWIAAQLNQTRYPSRLASILFLKSDSALKYSLGPTKQAIIDQTQSLIDELNEEKVSNAQLQEKYNKVAQDAQKAQDLLKVDDQQVVMAQKNVEQVKVDAQKDINAKQQLVDDAQVAKSKAEDQVRTSQAKSLEDLKKAEQVKRYIESILLGLTVLFILGAVYGPINIKLDSAIGSALCLGLVFLVQLIQVWMIMAAFGAIAAGIGISVYIKYHKSSKLNGVLVGAIQDVKTDSKEAYNTIVKPKLTDWMKDNPELDSLVNDKLVQLNLVNKSDIVNK